MRSSACFVSSSCLGRPISTQICDSSMLGKKSKHSPKWWCKMATTCPTRTFVSRSSGSCLASLWCLAATKIFQLEYLTCLCFLLLLLLLLWLQDITLNEYSVNRSVLRRNGLKTKCFPLGTRSSMQLCPF